jgi:outer membrane receptor protein involved in Fe transport
VEVIKGVASALYGGTALAGVLNLVARPPGSESELLLNGSSHRGADAVGFFSAPPNSAWGYTVIGGAHNQSREDVDHDGWADVPGYTHFTVRPRLYWSGSGDRSVFATLGFVNEDRTGGTLPGRVLPNGSAFAEALHTQHVRRCRSSAANLERIAPDRGSSLILVLGSRPPPSPQGLAPAWHSAQSSLPLLPSWPPMRASLAMTTVPVS